MKIVVVAILVLLPAVAFASGNEAKENATLFLNAAIAAMQVYLTSKLPSIDKRLAKVESELKDFIEGIVR